MLQKLYVAYFSPTGGTKRAALFFAQGLAKQLQKLISLCLSKKGITLERDDVIIIAAPVFGGRIPDVVLQRLRAFQGNNTMAITAVVYGNRAFDDALLNSNDCVKEQGFHIVASMALVAEHSMAYTVANGRPDEQDRLQLGEFAKGIF